MAELFRLVKYDHLPRFPFPPDLPGFFEDFRPLFGACYGTIIPKPSWVRCVNGSLIYPDRYLVGGDWNHGILNDFPYILGIRWTTDELIFFRGVQTTNQMVMLDSYARWRKGNIIHSINRINGMQFHQPAVLVPTRVSGFDPYPYQWVNLSKLLLVWKWWYTIYFFYLIIHDG